MNEYTLESFINFCDEYQVANESFSSIKAKLVEAFSRLVLWIESKVKKMKDSKVKATLLSLLSRANKGLSKSKSLNEHNPEMVKKLQEEMSDIKEEVNKINETTSTGSSKGGEIREEFKRACDDNQVRKVRIMLKDATLWGVDDKDTLKNYLSYATAHVKDLWDEDDGDSPQDEATTIQDKYNKLAVRIVYNFSKKKWNELVKLAEQYVREKNNK